jgi:hypothetical protein
MFGLYKNMKYAVKKPPDEYTSPTQANMTPKCSTHRSIDRDPLQSLTLLTPSRQECRQQVCVNSNRFESILVLQLTFIRDSSLGMRKCIVVDNEVCASCVVDPKTLLVVLLLPKPLSCYQDFIFRQCKLSSSKRLWWSSGYDSRLGHYKIQLREVPGSSPG